ncbi:serine/threonine protein kinase [Pseudomonas sp. SJZ103]|uniref:protein kinase domain-containing protein n=1 Tax=unclassified Pseudomonas TaxID=196821 RepID=UPI0011A3F604|nr:MULTISPECIES: protein kinase [unclassified Pseudomonas]TWC65487.1 serine/threonine protein kinase [Pseudomonas sp. SJZ103]TWC82351.1 serine/threonine protein kinase [Pseudomonas sp. SJZ094]
MDSAEAKVFSDSLLKGGPLAGWELLRYLSHGKSAVVMEARQDALIAVIKVFHPGLIEHYGRDAQIIRINRERSLIDKQHENIVRVLDAGSCEETGQLFVAMDLAAGRPLSDVLNLIPRSKICVLIEQLARAAIQLENWGFTHRDIKPSNIHVSDDFSSLMLLDFGVMKPHGDDSATIVQASKAFIGTHQYSPPEMIHGREENTLDGWRAITFYQIGAVLHDMIARKPIFDDSTSRHADLVVAIDNKAVVVAGEEVDPHLCNLATRCLLKNPIERLELVRWDDFIFSDQGQHKPTLNSRKEALQRKLKLGDFLGRVNVIHDSETQRLNKVRLSTIVKHAKTQFDIALVELSGVMPTRLTDLNGLVYPNPAVTYTFSPAPNLGLDLPFRIQVAVALHEDRNTIDVYARASKRLADTEVGWTHLGPTLESLESFSDVFQEWIITIVEELISQ